MSKPLIVITNDDGIFSPGIRAAAAAVCHLGEVIIAAPSKQKSGTGCSFIAHSDQNFLQVDLDCEGTILKGYHIDATPALVVQHCLFTLCHARKPDMVISGINYGENLGFNVLMSGTVGAAMEAARHGIPAIAVSLETEVEHHTEYGECDWRITQAVVATCTAHILKNGLMPGIDLLNINVPTEAKPETPWQITRQSRDPYYTPRYNRYDDQTRLSDCQVIVNPEMKHYVPGTDIYALCEEKHISISPLSIQLTPDALIGQLHAALAV